MKIPASVVWLGALVAIVVSVALHSTSATEIRGFSQLPPGLDTIKQSVRDVPITCQADVVVAGGGVAGVAAALRAANAGRSVVLVEERNCLGHESTTAWAIASDETDIPPQCRTAAKLLAELMPQTTNKHTEQVSPDRCKEVLHRLVAKQNNIRVFFFSLPVGVVVDQGRVVGLAVANRAGRQIFLAKAVVDATEDQRIAIAAGVKLAQSTPKCVGHRLISLSPLPSDTELLKLSSVPALSDCKMSVLGGRIALTCNIPSSQNAAKDWANLQRITLDKSVVLRNLWEGHAGKTKSFSLSPEVWLPPSASESADATNVQHQEGVKGLTLAPSALTRDLDATGNVPLWSLAGTLISGDHAGRVAGELADESVSLPKTRSPGDKNEKPADSTVRELLAGPDAGIHYPVLRQEEVAIPVSQEVDVLVVGGGTSGAIAAISAARHQARVAIVETLPNLGGTSSNRVNTYYWGVPWKSLLSQEIDQPIMTIETPVGNRLRKARFSGEGKKNTLQELATKAGVVVHYRSFGVGAVVEGNRVVGVVIENASGRHVIRAKVVIDATGHADIAAAAGAAFDTGRPIDGFLHEAEHGPLRDALDPEDISKFYLQFPQRALSLNIRESRRIHGDYTVTFQDVLTVQSFPDVIAHWYSNYDTHFPHSANQEDDAQDWMAILGLFRKPLWGSIPYRAILPNGLDHLLVVGKAYSATHDALMGGRMQRDLQHLGEAAGVAAAMACQRKCSPRELSIRDIQTELVRLGVLLPQDLAESHLVPNRAPRFDLAAISKQLGTELSLDAMVELYRAGGASIEHLIPLLKSEDVARRTEAALILGMLGRAEAVPVLLDRLERRDPRTFEFDLPDASSRSSVPVHYSAVILLGRQRVQEAANPIMAILKDPDECPPNLASFAIVALERIGDKSAIEVIKPYLNIKEPVVIREENMRFEVHWGVRTNAARALARLGDYSGVPILLELLEADQSRLRNYAQRLLEEISGQAHGKDRQAWDQWWREKQAASGQ